MSALSTRVNVYFLLLLSPDMCIILTPLPRMRKKRLFPPSLYPSLISSPLPLNKKRKSSLVAESEGHEAAQVNAFEVLCLSELPPLEGVHFLIYSQPCDKCLQLSSCASG